MRQLYRYKFLLVITFLFITLFVFFKPGESPRQIDVTTSIIKSDVFYNQSIDNFTLCLFEMREALNTLSIPWFLTHGTALMYWRSKNFISDDMDIGVFYEDLVENHLNETDFLKTMENKFDFRLSHTYGELNHGKEWTFSCPEPQINIDIFVFYPFNESNSSFAYWTASYNGLCNKMIYKKCRWGFSKFNLTTFDMYEQTFRIVSLEFIIERYGKDYMIPKKYNYFQSLKILPNLLPDYKNGTENETSQKNPDKRFPELLKKGKKPINFGF